MRNYTIKIHMQRMAKMLERKDPCGCCPAGRYYLQEDVISTNIDTDGSIWENRACGVCQAFVDIFNTDHCPCYYYGEKAAIEKTIKKLKENGVL